MQYGSDNNVIEMNNIYDEQAGLQFQHPGSNVLIKNNSLHNNNVAIDMVVSSATGWVFSYNKFYNNGQAGDLWCGGATFYKNEVWNNTSGLSFWGSGGSILINNTGWKNTNYAFYTSSADSMSFYNNTAYKNGNGFGVGWADSTIMKNNFAINNTNYGFQSSSFFSQFTNNFVSGSNYGFYLSSAGNSSLRSNTIRNNNIGIYLLNSRFITIYSNEIYKGGQFGIYSESSNHTAITWNNISYFSEGIRLLKNINTTIRYNKIQNNTQYGVSITSTNRSAITWNEILGNGRWINYISGLNNIIEKNAYLWGTILYSITPNPAYDGWVHLTWQSLPWAAYYLIYRKFNAPISSFFNLYSMSPIQNVTPYQAIDSAVPSLGKYYYVIVAGNASCWSTISNNQWVNVTAYPRPATPILSAILPSISYNGQIKLDWNDAQNATRYYVYKHTAPINASNVGTLKPIAKVTQSSYTDNSDVNGTFHYAIIAGNPGFNSSVSNSQSVLVQRQPIPSTPSLAQITPRPDYDGVIRLDWSDTSSTTRYYVYRDTAFIASVTSRIPLAIVFQSNYTDIIAVNTTVYYVIVAGNLGFNGSISICRNITVTLYPLPSTPILGQINPGTDYDGIINLDWTDTVNTAKYYVYRDTALITNVNSLTPIATIFQSNYTDIIGVSGTFYYVIVASNPSRNSSISNCRSVTVMVYSVPGIPTLNPILPSPDYDGIIKFNWTSATSATRYYIYRELSPITNINSLHPIAMVTTTSYTDVVSVNGRYYYAILAGNPSYNASACSNNQSVIIMIVPPPGWPFLDPILPSYNGTIRLNWNDTINTLNYYIYKDTSTITTVTARTPYAIVTQSNYTDISAVNGTFFYVIMAVNSVHNSSISNCRSVLVAIYPPPNTPILNPIVPNLNTYGTITLDWTDTINTVQYYVYKSTSFISELGSLRPVATVTQSDYTYSELIDGIYYYVIVAENPSYNSSISNCENVTIDLYNPPETPILSPVSPSVTYNGVVQLEWTDAINATKYYIFRDISKITSITSQIPIAIVPHSYYTDILLVNDTFYYVIVAGNAKFNSSISNCENVTVELYPIPSIPTLNPIMPSVDYDGTIFLDWSDTTSTIRYYVYKDTANIISVNLLVPIAVITQSSYFDIIGINGTYYYVIVAGNLGFNSSLSICRSVKIEIYPSINTPILSQIVPSANYNGIIYLDWTDTVNTVQYYVYRDIKLITSISSLVPIMIVTQSAYTDILLSNGTIYYCIIAGNPSHNSSLSNCRSVTVALYSVPGIPALNPLPSISYDGRIHLNWTDTGCTTKYYVYRDTFFITNVNSLIPRAVVSQSEYIDVIGKNGTYFYVIIAGNPSQNSTMSNCWSVTVALSNPPNPTEDNKWIIIIIVIGACAAVASLVVFKVRSKPKGRKISSAPLTGSTAKLKQIKSEWKENLSIDDKIRALQKNMIAIEELLELSDMELSNYLKQTFITIPIKLIEFLQRLDAPLDDKLEIIGEFNNLSEEQKREFLSELTEI